MMSSMLCEKIALGECGQKHLFIRLTGGLMASSTFKKNVKNVVSLKAPSFMTFEV